MSLQFSRSLRSLKHDSFRASRIALILAILNMSVLLGWFFLGTITLYEVGSDLVFNDEGSLEAQFTKEGIPRLFPGQSAVIRIDAGPDQPLVTAPALLIDIDDGTGVAQFLVMIEDIPATALRGDLSSIAEIEVEVEYISPAALVLRASGKYLGGSQIPVSPQDLRPTEG